MMPSKSKADAIIAEFYNSFSKRQWKKCVQVVVSIVKHLTAKRKELADARDKKLKEIFTEAQMKQWKDEIEPSMNPPRGGGQRGGGK